MTEATASKRKEADMSTRRLSPQGLRRALGALAGAVLAAGTVVAGVTPTAGTAAGDTTGTTVRVSGALQSEAAELSAMSGDGRYVVYISRSMNYWGVYLYDRRTGVTERLTSENDMNPAISASGQYVAYAKYGSNRAVYMLDRATGKTTLESVTSSGTAANGLSDYPSLSADGRYVAFQSTATNLGATTGHGGVTQVYVHDNLTGTTKMVSVTPAGAKGDGNALYPDITPDGRYVAFASAATNLVASSAPPALAGGGGGGGGGSETTVNQVFVRDLVTGTTRQASVSGTGASGDASSAVSYGPSISNDGNLVAFDSAATNLVPEGTNGGTNAFVHDMTTGTTTLVSTDASGQQPPLPPGGSTSTVVGGGPRLSGDGKYVAFESEVALTSDDVNGVTDVYVRNLETGVLERASVPAPGGTEASGTRIDGQTGLPVPQINGNDVAISTDGRYISFTSNGDLTGDRPLGEDGMLSTEPAIYVRTVNLPTVTGVSPSTVGAARVAATLVVTGADFTPPSAPGDLTVDLGPGITATSVTWVSSTALRVTVNVAWNAPVGERVAAITNPGSDSARMPSAFQVVPRGTGYRIATAHGAMKALGSVRSYGTLLGRNVSGDVAGMAETASGKGYWLVAGNGDVFAFGDARWHGSLAGKLPDRTVVGMACHAGRQGLLARHEHGQRVRVRWRPLARLEGRAVDQRCGRRHHRRARRERVLARHEPRQRVRLRQCPLARLEVRPAPGESGGCHGQHPGRPGLLARHGKWSGVPLRERPLPRFPRRAPATWTRCVGQSQA